jgi:aryl-alcohol dehydrogenase-like predicted oxidoreductase
LISDGTAYVAYSPLGRGVFTGAIKKPEDIDPLYKQLNLPRLTGENFDKNVKLVEKIESIATNKGVKPGHVTLAWVIAKSPMILPIPGTSKLENLKDNIAASKTKLTQEEIKAIDDIVNSFNVSGQRYFGAGNDNLSH